jgi:secreted trypsin-like serine protease
MRAAFGVALSLALVGCSAPDGAATGSSVSAIVGGSVDTADPAIVLLASYPADQSTLSTCTASLVAPDVLLTAAHCVDLAVHAGETFGVFLGADANGYPTAADLAPELQPVKEVHIHPSYDPNPPFTADIGVAILESPLSTPVLPVRMAPLPPDIAGKPARIVGYGQTTYNQPNTQKNTADTVVAAVDSGDTLSVGDLSRRSCVGDSGGPALVMLDGAETIVGVDSYADLSGCLEPAHYRRTDVYASFLGAWVDAPGGAGGAAGSGGGTTAGTGGGAGAPAGGSAGAKSSGASSSDEGGCSLSSRSQRSPAFWLGALLAAFALLRRHSPRSTTVQRTKVGSPA